MEYNNNDWQAEATMQLRNEELIDRILRHDRVQLNEEQKKYLGYEMDDIIAYYSKSTLRSKDTLEQIEAMLRRSTDLLVIASTQNGIQLNMTYMRMANQLGHCFRIVEDNQFSGDTGLVLIKQK